MHASHKDCCGFNRLQVSGLIDSFNLGVLNLEHSIRCVTIRTNCHIAIGTIANEKW